MARNTLSMLIVCAALLLPALGMAQSSKPPPDDAAPTLLGYSLKGFWTGAVVGLAMGYISTGESYQSGEWRKLVVGAGSGALVGVGAGIALAFVDNGKPAPAMGWLILRDTGYGSLLGVFTGAAIGALVWAGGGRAKDVLMGGSIGTVCGAAVGVTFGVVEGLNAQSRHEQSEPSGVPAPPPLAPTHPEASPQPDTSTHVQLTLAVVPTASRLPAFGPALVGRF